MDYNELVLFLIYNVCQHTFDFDTRISISSVSRRFRKLAWTYTDGIVSSENYDHALMLTWVSSILPDRSFDSHPMWAARRLPRSCKKHYYRLARDLFKSIHFSDEAFYSVEDRYLIEWNAPQTRSFVRDYKMSLEKRGIRAFVSFDKKKFETGTAFVSFLPIKSQPKKIYKDEYVFTDIEEKAISFETFMK